MPYESHVEIGWFNLEGVVRVFSSTDGDLVYPGLPPLIGTVNGGAMQVEYPKLQDIPGVFHAFNNSGQTFQNRCVQGGQANLNVTTPFGLRSMPLSPGALIQVPGFDHDAITFAVTLNTRSQVDTIGSFWPGFGNKSNPEGMDNAVSFVPWVSGPPKPV